ncbi:hypothetical protein BRC62_06895, partial [Halobacteriales archaeon QH_10_67_13]
GTVDPGRFVAMGGSYGGFMVLASLTEFPERWAAGVDIVGIANFVTFLENTGDWRRELREAEYGSLAEDREFLESVSPTNNIGRIAAPLFVLHGENDPRVPVGEAEQIAERAREQGVPVEKLIFDDEGHGISKLENRITAYERIVEFLRSETLADPAPITGSHPGGPRRGEPPFQAVAAAIRSHYAEDSSGHDMAHVWRVFRLTQRFAEELGADRTVVGCAALVHDLHRVLEDGTGRDPAETTAEVARALERAGVDDETVGAVTHCVAVHDELALRGEDPAPETGEAEILRDADNLDAMGAIGIARAFAFGGAHGLSLWDETGERYSSLYHFE